MPRHLFFSEILMPENMDDLENIFSVSEITREIKELLELNLPTVWVRGEISNFVHHSSGHMYFSLKDENAQISCVMWRSRNAALHFRPADGMKINAYGDVRVYEKRGAYQLALLRMTPAGVGELQMAFEALKEKLRKEGLFDDSRKKRIPRLPQRIGIVTSATGAAIRDILTVLNRRFPAVEKILRPTLVQGEGAAEDIAEAIRDFNAYGQVDVLIVGRGGGSLEDLWAFNEQVVARAIAESNIPVVSAVGHQVDFTISDFVADLRAATPSAAAELLVPDRMEVKEALQAAFLRCYTAAGQRTSALRERLDRIQQSYAFRRPFDRALQYRQRIDDLAHSIEVDSFAKIASDKANLHMLQKRFFSLHPESILKRGYAIVQHQKSRAIVKEAATLAADDAVDIYFAKGAADARIESIDPEQSIANMMLRKKNAR